MLIIIVLCSNHGYKFIILHIAIIVISLILIKYFAKENISNNSPQNINNFYVYETHRKVLDQIVIVLINSPFIIMRILYKQALRAKDAPLHRNFRAFLHPQYGVTDDNRLISNRV